MQQTRQQQPFRCMKATEEATTAIEVEGFPFFSSWRFQLAGLQIGKRSRMGRRLTGDRTPMRGGCIVIRPRFSYCTSGLLCRSSSRTYGRTGSMTRGSCAHVLLLRDVVICRADLTDIIAYHATQLGQLGEGREKGRQKGIEWPALDRRARDNGAKRATEGDPRKGVMTWGLAGATASGLAIKSPIWYRIRCARSGATIIGSSKTTCRSRQKSCNCITSNSK